MIKVAMVKTNGEVAYTISPADDDMYADGVVYSGCVARHISHDCNDQEVLSTWYWNAGWQTRVAPPSDYYDWVDHSWSFSPSRFWGHVRGLRDMDIARCDWTQLTDSTLTTASRAEWVTYRQALRDVPEDYSSATSIDDVVWPTKP